MQKHNYKNKLFSNHRKAFTLVELLIVIAIIGILFIVLVSKIDFASDRAKVTGVQTDFRSFQVAFEQVAREHDGFATFGWDYGDANGNKIRDTYDEGDLNLNKKKDAGEVWTGHKVYGEEWTNVYSLKNPADPNDKSAIIALEEAINKNLDPKLHITIHDDLTITMANSAKDPWKTEYHGIYLSNAANDSGDRGAIIIYSNGANQEFGSEQSISDGKVNVSVPGNNVHGQDDMSIATVYSYSNGYGEVKTTTNGFSQNQTNNVVGSGSLDGNGIDTPFIPAENTENRIAGLYKTGTNTLIYSWDELVEMGVITSRGSGRGSIASYIDTVGPDQEVVDLLAGDLQFPDTLTSIPLNAFYGCRNLTGVILPKSITSVQDDAFGLCNLKMLVSFGPKSFNQGLGSSTISNIYFDSVESLLKSSYYSYVSWGWQWSENGIGSSTSIYINNELLEHLVVPDSITAIPLGPLFEYEKLKTVTLPESCEAINTGAFYKCINLQNINLDNVKTIGIYAFYNNALNAVSLNNIVTIKRLAFGSCNNLSNALIGTDLETIEYGAFASCSESLEIHFDGTLDNWHDSVSIADHTNSVGGVTYGKKYKLFIENNRVEGAFVVPTHWTTVNDGTFSGVSGITSLTVHDNVQKLGDYSFYDTDIVDLMLGNQLQEIGRYAFSNTPVKILNVPDSVITIGERAFYYCEEMLEVNINETSQMTTMGDYAFCYCTKIKSLYIPPMIKRLDAHGLVIYANSLKEFTFSPNTQLEYLNVSFGFVDFVTIYLPDTVKVVNDLGINVNSNSALVIGENSQLERMEGRMFDRYYGNLYIPKNLYYISESWASFQFSPKVNIHPENKYFKYENGCLIDIENKRLIASNSGAVIPTDGSVTSIGASACCYQISYIPKVITSINNSAWDNATGYRAEVTYEGTMEEWRAISGTNNLVDVKQVTCSDGIVNSKGEQINP